MFGQLLLEPHIIALEVHGILNGLPGELLVVGVVAYVKEVTLTYRQKM